MLKLSMILKKCVRACCIFICAATLMGCSTSFTNIAPEPPENYDRLGFAHGKATGSLGILGTAYYFIPMGLNSRIDRAYDRALESVPGATSLINVTYEESWYWWLIGTARTVSVYGEAIREVTQ